MSRFFIYLSYDGSKYNGWQTQPNGITVQESIEKALSTLLRHPTPIVGAGRTDAGVHARMMIAHFDAEIETSVLDALANKLNAFLPNDIAIQKIVPVTDNAHARFDATSRLYKYYVTTRKDPFKIKTHFKIHGDLDLNSMNKCASILFEFKDFTSFSKLHTDVKTNNCKIMHAGWEQKGHEYIFTIKADRFLRNMVRAIVGTLIDAGKGKIDANNLRKIITAKDRCAAGTSVPGHALFLEEVEYPDNLFL